MTRRDRMQVLAICCMSILLVSLDNTIVNVALPTIRRDLDASLSQLQWIVDAYTVVLATLLILCGSIADRIGRKRVFSSASASSSLGSLLCSTAPTPGWLIVFRALQGVGGSMLNPVAMSIIRNVFTDPRERAQAIGVWGGVVGISMALGPVVGGALDGRGRLALDLLDQRADRHPRDRARGALRARVARGAAAADRPARPGAGDGRPGLADLRDHRGRRRRLGLGSGVGFRDRRRGRARRVRRA